MTHSLLLLLKPPLLRHLMWGILHQAKKLSRFSVIAESNNTSCCLTRVASKGWLQSIVLDTGTQVRMCCTVTLRTTKL